MTHPNLHGIWTLKAIDLQREAAWYLERCETLIDGLHRLLTNNPLTLHNTAQRAGFHTYPCNLAGDIAYCLRFARNESDMEDKLIDSIEARFKPLFGLNLLHFIEIPTEELNARELPVPDVDLKDVEDRVFFEVLRAARGRRCVRDKEWVPSKEAAAVTGWSIQKLAHYSNETTGKIQSKRIKKVLHYDHASIDAILQSHEEIFFNADYKPL